MTSSQECDMKIQKSQLSTAIILNTSAIMVIIYHWFKHHHVGIPFSDVSAVYCAGGWYMWCVSSTSCKQLLDQMQIKLKKNMTTWMMFSHGWDGVQYKRLKESKPGGRAIINKNVCCISLFTGTIWDNINLNVTSVDVLSASSTLCLLTL